MIHAGERGVTANDSVRVFDGSCTVYSGKTPIRSRHKTDGSKGYVLIPGGTFCLRMAGED